MKKHIILAAAFITIAMNLFAQNGSNINASVYGKFSESFPGAQHVTWTTLTDQISKAQFAYQGQPWIAFFDYKGTMLTSGRRIKVEALPLQVDSGLQKQKRRMEKKYGDLAIALIYEMVYDNGTRYYSTLENSITKITLSVCTNGQCIIEKKELKRNVETLPPSRKEVIAKN
ncbi:MAG: hypothetical protein WA874_15620 [Chryseosolibacter sp.]